MKKGFLVTFEGGDACGKSTQIKLFTQFLKDQGIEFVVAREPGGTEIGEKIRELLLGFKGEISPEVEILLFSASRAEHVNKIVKPALEQGKVVVLDRYFDSSYAYQGFAGSLNFEDLKNITDFAIDNKVPDLTFLLDISVEDAMRRKMANADLKNLDRIESKGKEFHVKVREGYLKLAKMFEDRIYVVDAAKTIEEVFENITQKFLIEYQKKNMA